LRVFARLIPAILALSATLALLAMCSYLNLEPVRASGYYSSFRTLPAAAHCAGNVSVL
jgi:hypothetical protein